MWSAAVDDARRQLSGRPAPGSLPARGADEHRWAGDGDPEVPEDLGAGDENAGHNGVGPVVIAGDDDRQQREGWVQPDEVGPATSEGPGDTERNDHGPTEMQRWHGGELV